MTPGEIYLAAYDEQIRARITAAEIAAGRADRSGPVIRKIFPGERGLITYRDLAGLTGTALDDFIALQRDHFARLGIEAEWKYHSHDRPADLPERLAAAGFVPEDTETLLIGESARLAAGPGTGTGPGPDPGRMAGVTLREVTKRADLERIRDMEQAVWGDDHDWLPGVLGRGLTDPDDPCVVVAAEAGRQLACAGWIRFHRGTDFASLWAGRRSPAGAAAASTVPPLPTGPGWPRAGASGSSRSTLPRTASQCWPGSGWRRWPRRSRSSGTGPPAARHRRIRQVPDAVSRFTGFASAYDAARPTPPAALVRVISPAC